MGKIEGIFATNISGKVGNVVFRKNGKQNIVSQRPASVKNPRTDMQQRQRAYIKTVASAYSVLKPICDHSFEGVAYGAKSMQFFYKKNYVQVRNNKKIVLKNSSDVVVPIPFIISSGTIDWAGFKDLKGDDVFQLGDISSYVAANKITDLTKLTATQFLQILDIKGGDQITIIKLVEYDSIYSDELDIIQYPYKLVYSRYIINESAAGNFLIKHENDEGNSYYTINPVYLAAESMVDDDCQITILEDKIFISGLYGIWHRWGGMCSVIISRKTSDAWNRSTAYVSYPKSFVLYEDFTYDIDKVLPSYHPTGERYLNNAEK